MPYAGRYGASSAASPADSAACTALAGRYSRREMLLPAVTAAVWQWTLSPPQPSSAAAVTKPRRSGVRRRMPLVSSSTPAASGGRGTDEPLRQTQQHQKEHHEPAHPGHGGHRPLHRPEKLPRQSGPRRHRPFRHGGDGQWAAAEQQARQQRGGAVQQV